MKEFWTWAVTEGAPIAQGLGYATIGPGLEPRILEAIERINSAN